MFITKEEATKRRTENAQKLDLMPFIGLSKAVLVREVPFNAAVRMRADTGPRDPAIMKALAEAVLDPATGEPLSAEDLNLVFELAPLSKGAELLTKLSELAFPKKTEDDAAGK